MKGLEFAIVRYGSIWNDPAWNLAVPNPASASRTKVESTLAEYPASFILIKHPQIGYILYDVGDYPSGEDGVPRSTFWKEYFPVQMVREDYVDQALPRNGVPLSDIACIILSHMHYDHAGGIKFFPGTRAAENVYVPKADFEAACLATLAEDGERDTDSPYWRSVVTTKGITYRFLEQDVELFPGVHVFLLAGHTPAVGALLLECESGNYLFPNDACSSRQNYGPPAKPTAIMHDSLAYQKSAAKLRQIEQQYHARLIFSHDLDEDRSYQHLPVFYR
ncbi:N-acyl homoserine lactonase family protein [Agathobaculum sp.]|uniref:N-acyl homoserine lactonase family protein n=1 Tax=Agathobaculum sp. TaxID=2048138 RepID=UPI002A821942|nr:N-acyl homoserine lactonase family protein [Agathobaculum sp.]MDY3619143.1 N-acyl homoserine lactonase family protein [Agathobaculum sp.]